MKLVPVKVLLLLTEVKAWKYSPQNVLQAEKQLLLSSSSSLC